MSNKQLFEESYQSVISLYPDVAIKLDEIFDDTSIAGEWLITPLPALSGLSVIEVLQQGKNKQILELINRLKYGDFS